VADENRLIIISGLSGSGKTIALHALEDLGYYCIDNMPAGLLRALLDEIRRPDDKTITRVAVGVDARNRRDDLEALPELIREIEASGIATDLLFLQADDDVLLKRYSETRRRHPLADVASELRAAIKHERELLGSVINAADLVIDSSRTSVYELADVIQERVDKRRTNELSILLESFGFKHGIPADADFVFDLRCLPNPYWNAELRRLNGLDQEVAGFLDNQPAFEQMYADILSFLQRWIPEYVSVNRSYLTVALGCTGGQHRSVRMAEKLAAALSADFKPVHKRHNALRHDRRQDPWKRESILKPISQCCAKGSAADACALHKG
jgi:UPF0042 nucleotide-binding protein